MPYTVRDGVHIYYENHGQGLPVLLSHGFGASTGMWQTQIEAFQDTYRLIPWDMRGHGQSDSPDEQTRYSHAHTIEDMRAILDTLHIDQAVIAGHSLGGFMSLAFHVKYPAPVEGLILQGCGPGYRNPETRAAWNYGPSNVPALWRKEAWRSWVEGPSARQHTTFRQRVSKGGAGYADPGRRLGD